VALENFYDAEILAGPWRISGDANEVQVETKQDTLECTRFGNTEHRYHPGLQTIEINGKGYVNFDSSTTPTGIDAALTGEIGASAKAITVAEKTTNGAIAYIAKTVQESYSWDLKQAELGRFDFKVKGNQRHARGRLILPLTSRTVSGVGAIHQLGALSATQRLVAALHVTEFVGTSLIVVIRSNDTNDTVTPTLRATFATQTGPGSDYQEVAGAVTDTYWYADFTFVGTSFKAAVSAGIR
jgi:hypothetical protein